MGAWIDSFIVCFGFGLKGCPGIPSRLSLRGCELCTMPWPLSARLDEPPPGIGLPPIRFEARVDWPVNVRTPPVAAPAICKVCGPAPIRLLTGLCWNFELGPACTECGGRCCICCWRLCRFYTCMICMMPPFWLIDLLPLFYLLGRLPLFTIFYWCNPMFVSLMCWKCYWNALYYSESLCDYLLLEL